MSRSGYHNDVDPIDLICWRGRVMSATRGKRGQKLLRDLAAALDAMPVKRLIAEDLVREDGDCCALGAVGLHRGMSRADLIDTDGEDSSGVAAAFDIAEPLAREIAYQNDEAFFGVETPEQRWVRMRAWVEGQIAKAPAP